MNEEIKKEAGDAGQAAEVPDEIETLKKQCDEYLNGWKRAKADFLNYQKDEMRRREDIVKFSNEYLMKELLPVLDSFAISLSMVPAGDPARKGIEMIDAQLERILGKNGLEPVKSLGAPFDASLHEALGEVDSEQSPGTVVEELEKGWKLHGKVIRPARVKVAK